MKKIKFKVKKIPSKEKTVTRYFLHCPKCDSELFETGKDYRPFACECGDWYWNEEKEEYNIH